LANVKAVIDVDINTGPAAQGIRQIATEINAFQSALNKANKDQAFVAKNFSQNLKDAINSSKFFTAETVRMQTSAARLDQTLSKGSVSMGQFFSARFRKGGLEAASVMSLANARAAAMQTQFIATGAAANGMRDAIAIRPLQAFNSAAAVSAQRLAIHRAMLHQATTSMINFGKNTQWAGRQLMVGFTVPLTIFGGIAGKVFRDLEKEAVNFRKVYGDIFTTDEETDKALESVKALASEFTKLGVSAQKTMQLAAIAAQAGQRGAELQAATIQATRLAVLGDMEQQESMRTTIALQSAFKLSSEELADAINFLNMVENSSVMSLQDLAGAIPRVAPVIVGLGGDVKDMAVMLTAMREGGVSAAEAANGLKSSLGRLITPSKQARDMAESFGISLENIVQRNRGDILATVMDLAEAMKSLGDLEQQKLLSTVFGKFQYARIGALFQNITREGSQAQRIMQMMAMSTEEMAATAERELGAIEESAATKLTAAMERLKISIAPIGEMFVRMSIPIINMLASIAEKFNNLPDFAKKFIAFGTVLIGLVIPAGTMFAGLLMNLTGTLIKVGHLVGLAFKGFLSGGLAGAINNVSQALKYVSLGEIDAANAAKQLGSSTEFVNKAFRDQVVAARGSQQALAQLMGTLVALKVEMQQVAALSRTIAPAGAAMGAAGAAGAAARRGRPPLRRNMGGTIPGSGNTDTVPAMLTPGEFVVNKQATQQNLPILHAINDGQSLPGFNKGGQIPGMQYFARPNPIRIVQETDADVLSIARGLQERMRLGRMPTESAGLSQAARQRGQVAQSPPSGAVTLDKLPKEELAEINNRVLSVLRKNGLTADPKVGSLVKSLPYGVWEVEQAVNNLARQGKLNPRVMAQLFEAVGTKNPFSALFDTAIVRSSLIGKGVTPRQAMEELSPLLSREFASTTRMLSDAQAYQVARKVFTQAGYGDLYSVLNSQRGAIRASFETAITQTMRNAGMGSSTVGSVLKQAYGAGNIVTTKAGGRTSYVIKDPNTGKNILITPGHTMSYPSMGASYEKIPLTGGAKAGARMHFMEPIPLNKGGLIPGMQYFAAKNKERVVRQLSHLDDDLKMPANAKRDFHGLGTTKGAKAKSAFVASYPDWINQGSRAGNLDKARFISYLSSAGPEDYRLIFDELGVPENKRAQLAKSINERIVSDLRSQKGALISDDGRKGTVKFSKIGKSFYDSTPSEYRKTLDKIRTTVAEIREPRASGRGTQRRFRKSTDLAIIKGMATVAKQKAPGLRGSAASVWDLMKTGLRLNSGGMIPGGPVSVGRSFYGRFNAKTIELFRKWVSSQPTEIAATKAAIGKDPILARGMGSGFRSSRKAETLQRATFMKDLPKPGETVSLGSLASFSPKGTPVSQHLLDSKIRKDAEFASYWLSVNQRNQRASAARLREVMADPSKVPSWAPERRFFDPRTREKGLDAWIKNEQRSIEMRKAMIKNDKAVVREYNKLNPTIIELKTPRGTIRADVDDIVPKAQQQYLGKSVAESERILHNAQIKINDVRRGEDGITTVFANLMSSSRPGFNIGGMIPGYNNGGDVAAFMQGSIFESAKKTIVPGVGNTDTVPAALTPGEFVVNKQATRENLPLLRAINNGVIGLNKGGMIPGVQYLMAGAPVDDPWSEFKQDPPKQTRKERLKAAAQKADQSKLSYKLGGRLAGTDLAAANNRIFDAITKARALGIPIPPELLAYEKKFTGRFNYKRRDIRKATQPLMGLERAIASPPLSPVPSAANVGRTATAAATGASGTLASTVAGKPTGTYAGTGAVLGYTPDGKPVTNYMQATQMAQKGLLFDGPEGQRGAMKVRPIDVMKKDVEARKQGPKTTLRPEPTKQTPASRFMRHRFLIAAGLGALAASMGIGVYEFIQARKRRPKEEATPTTESLIAAIEQEGIGLNAGNLVPGFGSGDVVPAMLTPGEFVVNKGATKNNLDLLRAINSGTFVSANMGGMIPNVAYMALGDIVPDNRGQFMVEGRDGRMFGPMPEKQAKTRSKQLTKASARKSFVPGKGGSGLRTAGMIGAGMAGGLGLSMIGQQAGQAIGGDAGGMIGSIAGFIGGDILTRKILGGAGGKAIATALKAFAVSLGAAGAAVAGIAAAAVVAGYALYKMGQSNMQEFEKGKVLADAMTTSADDIKALGTSARQRAANMDRWLDQSEAQFIQEEYAGKIAKAKTEAEKKSLKAERDKAMQERGTMTRRQAEENFFTKQTKEAKKQQASEEDLRRLYEQRNRALGVSKGQKLDFGLDKTFGAEFIKGAGQKDFEQFQTTRDFAKQVNIGQRSQAELETMRRLSDAAYGITSSVQSVAELDMASKLAQYVLSGALSEDQASSIAEAVGAELGDLKIGQNIRTELVGIVGGEGQFARNRPGQVAQELMERNQRRTQEMQNITRQNLGWLLAQRDEDQTPGRTKRAQAFDPGAPAGFNLFTQFFSGMADEARRNVGSLIEIQTSEYQMLQENIDAVGLAYNDLIAKAKTLADAETYRIERARAIEKLQRRRDELEKQRMDMLFGSEENRIRLTAIGRQRIGSVREREMTSARARQTYRELDPLTWQNLFTTGFERLGKLIDIGSANVLNFATRTSTQLASGWEEGMPSSFAQIMTSQMREVAFKKYEGTTTEAALRSMTEALEAAEDPIFAGLWQNILDDENFAMIIPAAISSMESKIRQEVSEGKIGEDVGRDLFYNIVDILATSELPADVKANLGSLFASITMVEKQSIVSAFDSLGDLDLIDRAYERFEPLLTLLGKFSAVKLPSMGDQTVIESIIGDPEIFAKLARNDKSMTQLMKFFEIVENLDSDLKIRFLEQFSDVEGMLNAMKDMEKIKFEKIVEGLNKAKDSLLAMSKVDLSEEEAQDVETYITNLVDKLNSIEDPEIRARLTAEIAPEFWTMQEALRLLQLETDPARIQDLYSVIRDSQESIRAKTDTAIEAKPEKPKPTKSGSGTKEDPLGDLMRQLRDSIDLLANIGTEMLAVGRKSKSIFDKLREENVNEGVIAYLRSMGPEQALKVGNEVLKNRKKLNTLMQLVAEQAIAEQQDAARVAQERAKFTRQMLGTSKVSGFKALSGAPMMDLEAALGDETFMTGMEKARGSAKPNKAMREFQRQYFARQEAERRAIAAAAPTIVASQAQQNIGQTYATNQLRRAGLTQQETEMALQNDAIMTRVKQRLKDGKSIGPVIVKLAKDLYKSTKDIISILDEGVTKIGGVFDFLSNALTNAMQQIDRFTIAPLQDAFDALSESNAKLSETQRRLSRGLTELQKEEQGLREEQEGKEKTAKEEIETLREREKEIGKYYDTRIKALETIQRSNREIYDQQAGQLDLASALSRGDLAAAARAANEMQRRNAEAKSEAAISSLRDRREKELEKTRDQIEEKQNQIDSDREAMEEKIKKLTIEVNGEKLTRKEIDDKIYKIETDIYNNSLKQYDIEQKINAAIKEREKIQKKVDDISIARRAFDIVSQINEAPDDETKKQLIAQAKLELQLLGTPEAKKIIQAIDANFQSFFDSDPLNIAATVTQITSMFEPIISKTGEQLTSLNIQIPNIQKTINDAVTTVNEQVPGIFAALQEEIEDLKESIGVEANDPKNPFRKVYQAAKKVAALIAAEFAKIPVKPGSGGGGGGAEEPQEGLGEVGETTPKLGPSFDPGLAVTKERGKKKRLSGNIMIGDTLYTATKYYDESGREIPGLTRYQRTYSPGKKEAVPREISRSDFKKEVEEGQRQRRHRRRESYDSLMTHTLPSTIPMPSLSSPATRFQMPPGANRPFAGNLATTLGFLHTLPGSGYNGTASPLAPQTSQLLGETMNFMPGVGGVSKLIGGVFNWFLKNQAKPTQEASEALVRQTVEGLDPQMKRLVEGLGKDALDGIVKGIVDGATNYNEKDVREAIIQMLKDELDIGSPAKAVIPVGNSVTQGIFKGIIDTIVSLPGTILTNLISGIKKLFGITGDEASSTNPSGESLMGGIFRGMLNKITRLPGLLWEKVRSWIWGDAGADDTESNKTKPVGESLLGGIFGGMKQWLLNTPIGRLWTFIRGWIWKDTGADDAESEKSKPAGTSIVSGIFAGIRQWLKDAPGKLWTLIWGWITGDITNKDSQGDLSDIGGDGKGKSPGIMGGIKEGIKSWIANTSFGQFITDVIDGFKKALGQKSIIDGLKGIGQAIWSAIADAVIGSIPGGSLAAKIIPLVTAAVRRTFGGPIPKLAYGGRIGYRGSREQAPGMAMGGKMKKYAAGAFVPGTGITDSVPALLTPGEFVVRKSVAQAYGPMLQALNSQVYPEMNKFAMGGFAGNVGSMSRMASNKMFPSFKAVARSRSFPTMSGRTQSINVGSNAGTAARAAGGDALNVEYNYNVNVNAQTNASSDAIANAVVYKFRRMEARQVRGTRIG